MPDNIEAREIEPMPSQQVDPLLYRMIVGALAAALLLVVIGALVLSALKIEVGSAIIGIGSFCAGALGGTLGVKALNK